MYVCAGEVAGARGDERNAAERRPQAEAEAPTRQGVLPSRGRKVGHFLDCVAHSECTRLVGHWGSRVRIQHNPTMILMRYMQDHCVIM